jgi:hypothetical protein
LHFNLKYQAQPWTIKASYNRADFYDLAGPTKTSRKGYALGFEYEEYFINENPKTFDYKIKLAGYRGLERLPDFQNIAASFDQLLAANMSLNYKNLRKSLGAIEDEKGPAWNVNFDGNYVNRKLFPLLHASFDRGFLLSRHHSSLWLRSSAGYAFGDRHEPFANFYFGGFGNNWIDYQEAQRYREYYSFPGAKLNAIGGTNYGKLMLEWTLPPLRFRRVGVTSMYARWMRLALFSSGIAANFDSPSQQRKLLNAGGQLDVQLVLFSVMKSTLSLGYAAAVEKDRRISKEFMISLKILE